ncbi:NACHT domain-containing protein [Hymenobacter mucosus]|nr:hypothetical protein [Hymenobacter mucosus]
MPTNYSWQRRWLPLTAEQANENYPYEFESSGYAVATKLGPGLTSVPVGTPLDELRDGPQCVILLGEPGIGKSNEWQKQQDAIGRECNHLFLNLGSFTSEETLYREIIDSPEVSAWKTANYEYTLTIWFDSLDEGLLHISRLQEGIIRILRRLPTERLRLRITCRNAIWPSAFSESLHRLWGMPAHPTREQFSIMLLGPLTQQQIMLAAEQEGFDSELFLRAIAQVEAQPLASSPVTLQLLIKLFRVHQPGFGISDTDGRAGLYELGCRELCEGPDRGREEKHRHDSRERLLLAGYLAFLAVFSNRRQIHIDPVSGVLGSNELDPHAAGAGQTTEWKGIQATISPARIRDLLANTALFTDLGNGCMVWTHQSYAEFLAAWYLNLTGITTGNLRALFRSSADPQGGIVPALRETAAWLAEIQPVFWQELLELDPGALIQSDMRRLSVEQRAAVVTRLIRWLDKLAFPPYRDNYERSFMHQLRHPGLAKQLTAVLANPEANGATLRFAIDVAITCKVDELAPLLIQNALDVALPFQTRSRALSILRAIADDDISQALRPLRLDIPTGDYQDDFRGYLLQILWPHHLSADELLPLLTQEKDDHYGGSYRMFLYGLEKEDISFSSDSVLKSLQWLIENTPLLDYQHAREAFWNKISRLVWQRAWQLIGEPGILDALAELFIVADKHHQPFSIEGASYADRISLLLKIAGLKNRPNPTCVIFNFHHQANLLSQDEWEGVHALLSGPLSAAARKWLTRVLMYLMGQPAPHGPDPVYSRRYNLLHEAARKFKSSRQAFEPWCEPVDSETEDSKKQKGYALDARKRDRKKLRKKLIRRKQVLRSIRRRRQYVFKTTVKGSDATFSEWHNLLHYISSEKTISGFIAHNDISHAKHWKKLTDEQRISLVDMACAIVLRYPIPPTQSYSLGRGVNNFAISLYRALLLAESQRPAFVESLPLQFWEEWATFIVKLEEFSGDDKKYALARKAWEKYPSAIELALFLKADAYDDSIDKSGFYEFKDWYNALPDSRFSALLLTAIENGIWREDLSASILVDMLSVSYQPAWEVAQQLLPDPAEAYSVTVARPRLAEVVYSWLLFNNRAPRQNTWLHWEKLSAQLSIAATVINRSVNHPSPSEFQHLVALEEEQLCTIILWLTYAFELAPADIDDWKDNSPKGKYASLRTAAAAELASRGTQSAWNTLQQLAEQMHAPYWLRIRLDQVRENLRRNAWQPALPDELIELGRDAGRRWLGTATDLQQLVLESLSRFQTDLHGELVAAEQLWTPDKKAATATHVVRDENFLSNTIRRYLVQDLQRSDILIKREVEIRPSVGPATGQRTDIFVEAFSIDDKGNRVDVLTVVVEVKLSKNDEVPTALPDQLIPYLADQKYKHGIYLVGWHYGQYSKRPPRHKPLAELHSLLQKQTTAANSQYTLRSLILDIRLPSDSGRLPSESEFFRPI